jgi:hypothetical protein
MNQEKKCECGRRLVPVTGADTKEFIGYMKCFCTGKWDFDINILEKTAKKIRELDKKEEEYKKQS